MTGPTVLQVVGELDIATAPGLVREALAALDGSEAVVLDLRHVDFIDCAGIRAVEAIERAAAERRRPLTVRTSPAVDRLQSLLRQRESRATVSGRSSQAPGLTARASHPPPLRASRGRRRASRRSPGCP